MDVKTAFLYGELDETVYMRQPEGFEEKGKEDHVCLLKHSIYGLKQSPRAWNTKLNNELVKLGFKRLKNEPCVYTRSNGNSVIILAVYVDDMLIFWNNEEELRKVKKDLMSKFEMKDLGKVDSGNADNSEQFTDQNRPIKICHQGVEDIWNGGLQTSCYNGSHGS